MWDRGSLHIKKGSALDSCLLLLRVKGRLDPISDWRTRKVPPIQLKSRMGISNIELWNCFARSFLNCHRAKMILR